LVDTLEATSDDWAETCRIYQPQIHDRLIEFLTESRWLVQYNGPTLAKLATLPIFPTEGGELVRLDDGNVYLPAGFTPPVSGSARLLKTNHDRWMDLLQRIVPRRLNAAAFIKDILLPSYPELDRASRVTVLGWLSEHWATAERELEQAEGTTAVQELWQSVRATSLVECTDGQLRPGGAVYHPHKPIVRAVLGEDVAYPDLTVYGVGEDRWLRFFAELGMASSPRAVDLLQHIDRLSRRAETEGTAAVAAEIQTVYEHLRDHWAAFESAQVDDPAVGGRVQFATALARRRWLPAQRDAKRLAQYFAALPPADRLYQPTELFPPRLGHVVASQRPISPYTEPPAKFRDALGFPKAASLDVVTKHFDHVLSVWLNRNGSDSSDAALFGSSLNSIYRDLGQRSTGRGNDADATDGDEGEVLATAAELDALRDRYRDQLCLWDSFAKRLWKPKHTFKAKVRFFEPLRRQLVRSPDTIDAGLSVLGRRDEPTVEDYVQFLQDMSDSCGEVPVSPDLIANIVEVQHRLAPLLDTGSSEGLIPVLCSDGRLRPGRQVFFNNTPWFVGTFTSTDGFHLTHPQTPIRFAQLAGVTFLSNSIAVAVGVQLERVDFLLIESDDFSAFGPLEGPDRVEIPGLGRNVPSES
jgi:hypothetical protein